LLTGGISAARAQQAGAYDPFATAISGLANNQSFQQGLEKYFTPSPTDFGAWSGGAVDSSKVGYNPARFNY
jgi:hypothetical protein